MVLRKFARLHLFCAKPMAREGSDSLRCNRSVFVGFIRGVARSRQVSLRHVRFSDHSLCGTLP